jgi:2-polyprenyl-6-methoxyphenol hydroxylase-like FAD-dependent oxidoreductase
MPDTLYTDVLVVGAGPVGLLTALGLAQRGSDTVTIGKLTAWLVTDMKAECTLVLTLRDRETRTRCTNNVRPRNNLVPTIP